MSKKSKIFSIAVKEYKKLTNNSIDYSLFFDTDFDIKTIEELQSRVKGKLDINTIFVPGYFNYGENLSTNIKTKKSSSFSINWWSVNYDFSYKGKNYKGIFVFTNQLYDTTKFCNINIFIGNSDIANLLSRCSSIYFVKDRKVSAKKGIYDLSFSPHTGLNYRPVNKIPDNEIYHPEFDNVFNSIEKFFHGGLLEKRLENNRSGSHKLLLYGEPGTGKSTISNHIALKYKKECCIVRTTEIEAVFNHMQEAADRKLPTIIIWEECSKDLGQNASGEGNSTIKSLLDGHLSIRNQKGTYLVMITNYPENIENTFISRPGRIHERIHIGALEGEDAVNCAKLYFKNDDNSFIISEEDMAELFKEAYTGGEIECIAELIKSKLEIDNRKTANLKEAEVIINDYLEEVLDSKNFKNDNTLLSRKRTISIAKRT